MIETTYGQDIDAFVQQYIPEPKRKLAVAELNLIVLKGMRVQLVESHQSFKKIIGDREDKPREQRGA